MSSSKPPKKTETAPVKLVRRVSIEVPGTPPVKPCRRPSILVSEEICPLPVLPVPVPHVPVLPVPVLPVQQRSIFILPVQQRSIFMEPICAIAPLVMPSRQRSVDMSETLGTAPVKPLRKSSVEILERSFCSNETIPKIHNRISSRTRKVQTTQPEVHRSPHVFPTKAQHRDVRDDSTWRWRGHSSFGPDLTCISPEGFSNASH
jgi:hypothetical protein